MPKMPKMPKVSKMTKIKVFRLFNKKFGRKLQKNQLGRNQGLVLPLSEL